MPAGLAVSRAGAAMDEGLGALFRVVDDRPGDVPPGLGAYEAVLVLVIAVEYWLRALPKWGELAPHYYVLLAVATIVCPLALTRRGRRFTFAALAASHAVLVWTEFPVAGNHAYLELLLCALAALVDPAKADEARLYVRAVRVMAVIILAYSGIQKLAHGHYRHGEYLAFSLGSASFRSVLRPILSGSEYDRLTTFTGVVGDGPYRVADWWVAAASNATWALEILLALLLCVRRTRRLAVVGALVLLLAIEAAAREVFFGLVFANAILLFAPGFVHRAAIPVAGALLLVLALSRLGLLPEITFY